MLSSLVGNIGMSGQVNYCAGNFYQNAMEVKGVEKVEGA